MTNIKVVITYDDYVSTLEHDNKTKIVIGKNDDNGYSLTVSVRDDGVWKASV